MSILKVLGKVVMVFMILALSLVIAANVLTYLPPFWSLPVFLLVTFLGGYGIYRVTDWTV